jgi:hypothetical protein
VNFRKIENLCAGFYLDLKRYLSIPRRLIFESRVETGIPSFVAAPAGPDIRPPLSASAVSIASFSCASNAPLNAAPPF